jgi:hypothetical protein
LLSRTFLLRQLCAAAKRLGWIISNISPSVLVADTVGAVLMLLLRSTNNDNMTICGLTLLLIATAARQYRHVPPILMCLYSVNLGLAMKFLRFA